MNTKITRRAATGLIGAAMLAGAGGAKAQDAAAWNKVIEEAKKEGK